MQLLRDASSGSAVNSSRPYIMRALYEWIVDNECTPYVLVDASVADVMVPQQYVKDNQIVLNISPDAVMDLHITNQAVSFNGRFGGVATDVYVPVAAVIGIYARENGQGMTRRLNHLPLTRNRYFGWLSSLFWGRPFGPLHRRAMAGVFFSIPGACGALTLVTSFLT